MTDKNRDMIDGMDRLLKKFNKFPNGTIFTVEEIIKLSNEVYDEIMKEDKKPDYEVKFDVDIKETIKCSKNFKWKLIHQETQKVLIVDTKTVFYNVASFYEYTVAVPHGPKIYTVTKLN